MLFTTNDNRNQWNRWWRAVDKEATCSRRKFTWIIFFAEVQLWNDCYREIVPSENVTAFNSDLILFVCFFNCNYRKPITRAQYEPNSEHVGKSELRKLICVAVYFVRTLHSEWLGSDIKLTVVDSDSFYNVYTTLSDAVKTSSCSWNALTVQKHTQNYTEKQTSVSRQICFRRQYIYKAILH